MTKKWMGAMSDQNPAGPSVAVVGVSRYVMPLKRMPNMYSFMFCRWIDSLAKRSFMTYSEKTDAAAESEQNRIMRRNAWGEIESDRPFSRSTCEMAVEKNRIPSEIHWGLVNKRCRNQ